MGRKPSDPDHTRNASLLLLVTGIISCALVYTFLSAILKPDNTQSSISDFDHLGSDKDSIFEGLNGDDKCCNGIEHLELWGTAVKWGSEFKVNSAEECCKGCKEMCSGDYGGACLCDSWVFCGDKEACGSKFGECWLKKQKDTMSPEKQDEGPSVKWTSGNIFAKGQGIVGLETEHGTIRIKLFPDCAPRSVAFILELLGTRYCAGCQLYRAESRGRSWDPLGNHIKDASFGPPYGLIQGTLEAQGHSFKPMPVESCPIIQRGSVAWVGSGPEFFVSLANHQEWEKSYTVFGSVLPEDMEIAEKIAALPKKPEIWNNVNVTVLQKPVFIKLKRV